MLLEQAGHEVVTARTEEDVRRLCATQTFDVAVIGQTLVAPEKERILRAVREMCPSAKLLELYQPHRGRMLRDADAWLLVPAAVPHDFVERVTLLAEGGPKPPRGRKA